LLPDSINPQLAKSAGTETNIQPAGLPDVIIERSKGWFPDGAQTATRRPDKKGSPKEKAPGYQTSFILKNQENNPNFASPIESS